MTIPGKGWAKKVTKDTLDNFRSFLRSHDEGRVQGQDDVEIEGSDASKDSPEFPVDGTHDSELEDTSSLFRGVPISVPPEFRSRPHGSIATPVKSPVAPASANRSQSFPPPPSLSVPQRRWYKQMSAADAQRPTGPNTNPTGHLTLVKGGHPIQQATWFRNDLFVGADWHSFTSYSGQREQAHVTFETRIAGTYVGRIDLDVTYTPRFEASQGNRTTVVHWGTEVGDLFKQRDYTGYFVTIERSADNEYALIIDSQPAGSFLG